MLKQNSIPQTPEEIAAALSQMPREDQCIVKGFILGMGSSRLAGQARETVERQAG